MTNEYDKQAEDFIKFAKIKVTIVRDPNNVCPRWDDGKHIHGDKYIVMFSGLGNRRLRFPFWNSYNDAREEKDPRPYDVLACISSDANCPETFEKFCSDYGYDTDSRKAEAEFKSLKAFAIKLRRFFTQEELDKLQEIQ